MGEGFVAAAEEAGISIDSGQAPAFIDIQDPPGSRIRQEVALDVECDRGYCLPAMSPAGTAESGHGVLKNRRNV